MEEQDRYNGDWFDKDTWSCKLCAGEIPYGHRANCCIFKMEKEIRDLERIINKLKDEVSR